PFSSSRKPPPPQRATTSLSAIAANPATSSPPPPANPKSSPPAASPLPQLATSASSAEPVPIAAPCLPKTTTHFPKHPKCSGSPTVPSASSAAASHSNKSPPTKYERLPAGHFPSRRSNQRQPAQRLRQLPAHWRRHWLRR